MMYGYDDGWGAGSWVLMSLLMLGVVGAVIASVLALKRSSRGSPAYPPAAVEVESGSALRILDERLARGEIDEPDYTARRNLLILR